MLNTWFNIRDLVDTRRRKLDMYTPYVQPLFWLLAPTGHDHVPYVVLQPPGFCWPRWSRARDNVEDDTIPNTLVWWNLREGLIAGR